MRPSDEAVSVTSNKTDYVCKDCWWVFENRYPDDMREAFQKGGKEAVVCQRCGGELVRIPYRIKDDLRLRAMVDPRPTHKTRPKPIDMVKYKKFERKEGVKKVDKDLDSLLAR